MAAKNAFQAPRSPKAGRPPLPPAPSPPRVRRRRKTATTAVRKDTMISQADEVRVRWGVGKPKEKKR